MTEVRRWIQAGHENILASQRQRFDNVSQHRPRSRPGSQLLTGRFPEARRMLRQTIHHRRQFGSRQIDEPAQRLRFS